MSCSAVFSAFYGRLYDDFLILYVTVHFGVSGSRSLRLPWLPLFANPDTGILRMIAHHWVIAENLICTRVWVWGHISMQEQFDHRVDGIKGNPKLVQVVLRLSM